MNTNYQMWLTYNAENEKLRLPVLPEKFVVAIGSNNSSVDVVGLGEIIVKQARPAYQFSFSSFFPVGTFPGLTVSSPPSPMECVNKIKLWIEGDKPLHLILTNVGIDTFCVVEEFNYYEQGGDVGAIYYDLTLKEYREVTVRQVKIEQPVSSPAPVAKVDTTPQRVDNTTTPRTYTVKAGDCLWNIAKKYYGNGAQYTKIYEANKDKIKNPNLIYVGQVFVIP